jgi:hypothetical protein
MRPPEKEVDNMPTPPAEDFWPQPLRHCARPLVTAADEEVIIGEITSEPIDGFSGNRMLYTALVPLEEVDSVLRAVGGIGHGVRSDPQHPAFRMGSSYSPPFSIDGPGRSKRFESLVHTWLNHNKTVFLPDSALLMAYGLIPRISKDGRIFWDDPDRLVYDVVRVIPLSTYSTGESTTARVTIRRDYLEDYLSLKGCAAVATYWDERYSSDDGEVAALMGERGAKFEQPGRELWFLPMPPGRGNQVSQVWGCALLLTPNGQPITDPPESELTWPDRVTPFKGSGIQISFEHFEIAYVRDEVLGEYEKRDEFEITPEAGFVSYDGRWSVSYCSRFGRNHIELELRKLYEGAPFEVIKHFNKFAVKAAAAEKDRDIFGTRHIGIRAKELVQTFLQLTATLSQLSDVAGLFFTQVEIGHFDSAGIAYSGWWTFPELRSLGHVVPLTMARSDFLSRCTEVFKLLENLQPAPLRHILIELGVKKDAIAEFKALKLLAAICQLATISNEGGFNLVSDRAQVSASWNPARIVPDLQPLFALNGLRIVEAHKLSSSAPEKVSDSLGVFGIDENQCRAGWGTALDLVYDRTASSLEQVKGLLQEACP